MALTISKMRFLSILALVVAAEAHSAVHKVSTDAELKTALTGALPGDIVMVADGVYKPGYVTMTVKATSGSPVVVKAEHVGKAQLDACLTLKGASHVMLEGFLFVSSDKSAVKLDGANTIRITRNTFRLRETTSLKWVYVGGANSHHNRIDHNLFEEKHQLGNFITIDGDSEGTRKSSQHDRIDHNHFRNIGPRANNEMEAIRIGWSQISMSSGFTVVEYNLFENCDGDPEIVSVKSCDDTVRYNTFLTSQGVLCARHGNRSVICGNFFLGKGKTGSGGVRIYGQDHKIYNNYFEGLTGSGYDAPLQIDGGDVEEGALSSHWRVYRAIVVFNTFVNNVYGIEIGRNYSKPPSGCVFANNIVTGSRNALLSEFKPSVNTTWEGNLVYPTASATAGLTTAGITVVDPKLVVSESLARLSSGSPAIDGAVGSFPFVVDDMDGQRRSSPDIGADELAAGAATRAPLAASQVGPLAQDRPTGLIPSKGSSGAMKIESRTRLPGVQSAGPLRLNGQKIGWIPNRHCRKVLRKTRIMTEVQ